MPVWERDGFVAGFYLDQLQENRRQHVGRRYYCYDQRKK